MSDAGGVGLSEGITCGPLTESAEKNPSMWAISYQQLMDFHEQAATKYADDHYDSKTMYDIVNEMIAPLCRRSKRSYALAHNPNGLKIDAFITHAWAEPFASFVRSIVAVFGTNAKRPNLWICSFAIMQGDKEAIKHLLDVPLEQAPFVKALKEASEYVVVRNAKTDVYGRLWCVCELMFAKTEGLVPDKTHVTGLRAESTQPVSFRNAQATDPDDWDKIVGALLKDQSRKEIDEFINWFRLHETPPMQKDEERQAQNGRLKKHQDSCYDDETVDACIVFQPPPNFLGQLEMQMEHANSIRRIVHRDYSKNPTYNVVTRKYNLWVSDGDIKRLIRELEDNHIRILIWCAEGFNELNTKEDVFLFCERAKPELIVTCTKYGSKGLAERLRDAGADAVIWMTLDPYSIGCGDLFDSCFLPFLNLAIPKGGKMDNIIDDLKAFKGCVDCDYICDSNFHLKGRSAADGVLKPIPSMRTYRAVYWLERSDMEDLVIQVSDLNLFKDTCGRIVANVEEGHKNYALMFKPTAAESVIENDQTRLLFRQRAVAKEICKFCAQDSHFKNFSHITHFTSMENVASLTGEIQEERVVIWVDLKKGNFSESDNLVDIVSKLMDSSKHTMIIATSDAETASVFIELEEFFDEVADVCIFNDEPAGSDIAASALHETICIRPIANNQGATCILDLDSVKDKPNKLVAILRESRIFSSKGGDQGCHISALYRDDCNSLQIRVCLSDIQCATTLRDLIVTDDEGTRKQLSLELGLNDGELIAFDRTSIAEVYEDVILRLKVLTPHQREALKGIRDVARVHVKAVAGSGKTFLAVNVALKSLRDHKCVLYVCSNRALAIHFAKWVCTRFQKGASLNRLYFLTDEEKNIFRVSINKKKGLLEEERLGESVIPLLGLVIVDEAHDVFGSENAPLASSARPFIDAMQVSQRPRRMRLSVEALSFWFGRQLHTPSFDCISLLLLSDISQSTDIENAIQYPEVDKTVELREVVRSSQRLVAGSLAFQIFPTTGDGVKPRAHHAFTSDGPALIADIFDPVPESDRYEVYANRTIRMIQKILSDELFPGLNLNGRLAVIVPDDDSLKLDSFHCALRKQLGTMDTSGFLEHELELVSALEASKTFGPLSRSPSRQPTSRPSARVVVDSSKNLDGLECLIVLGVGLDAPILSNRVRRRIYCAITRAHLLFCLVDEKKQGGWFECLTRVQLDKKRKFNFDEALKNTNDAATRFALQERSSQNTLLTDVINAAATELTIASGGEVSGRGQPQENLLDGSSQDTLSAKDVTGYGGQETNKEGIDAFNVWDTSAMEPSIRSGGALKFNPFGTLIVESVVSDPSMWAISYQQLMDFHEQAAAKYADDHYEIKTMYDIVIEMIVPLCKQTHTSYALAHNPDGLKIGAFITHAWAEPFPSFVRSIIQTFQSSVTKPNLWICSFALIQGDWQAIEDALRPPLEEAPFAKALKEASSYVLVRNSVVDVYSRLWCICELMFARKERLIPENTYVTGPSTFTHHHVAVYDAQASLVRDRDKIIRSLLRDQSHREIDNFINSFRLLGVSSTSDVHTGSGEDFGVVGVMFSTARTDDNQGWVEFVLRRKSHLETLLRRLLHYGELQYGEPEIMRRV